MVKLILYGCCGKMGQVVSKLAKEESQIQIVAGVDPFLENSTDYLVYQNLSECKEEADVLLDFSSPKALPDILKGSKERNLPIILCATGYSWDEVKKIEQAAEEIAVLRSANMSLGINLLEQLLKTAASILVESGFDIEVIEKHHNQKIDAPSGTALLLADAMNEVLKNEYKYIYDRSRERVKRDKKEIGISAVRGGSIVGEHEVIFAGIDEVIELKHTAYSKAVFGKGALAAAKFMKGKQKGLYNMQDVVLSR